MSEEMIYEAAVALCTNGVKNGAIAKSRGYENDTWEYDTKMYVIT